MRGRIAVIDNTIDPATGTVAVRAEFDNADDKLWPGQLCNLRVVLRTEQDVVSVPRTATQTGQNGNYVYVIENGVARVRPVKISRTQDGRDIVVRRPEGRRIHRRGGRARPLQRRPHRDENACPRRRQEGQLDVAS